jgi:F-type H+-transporting ATPase subunit delta
MSDKIARPYAAAAFAHAKETGAVSLWGDMFTALVATEETLQSAISGHTAGENTIAEALIDALDITDSGQRNFLRVLAQNQRLQATAAIAARFEQLRLQDEGISVIR